MKPIRLLRQNQLLIFLLFCLFNACFFSPSTYGQTTTTPTEILSHCITDDKIWQQLPSGHKEVTNYYILDHGVDLTIANNLTIQGKSVSLIDKGTRDTIGNQPYFLFHTLNISETKAFVRLYLAYTANGAEKTIEGEFSFIKENNSWVAKTKS